ncbi:MAG: hypothetical protein KF914_01680 [Rhizobiaceae bacterium]|nr:hypothetical protein [Rhizobiaceae bacterium]
MTLVDPRLVADIAVNLFGAAGLLVASYGLRRSSPASPVARRTRTALILCGALFVARSIAWASGSALFSWITLALAAVTPIAVLVVAEGLLRRHAPRWLKLALLVAAAIAIAAGLVPGLAGMPANFLLLAGVAGGFAASGILLARRDRSSLSEGENATIRRVLGAMLLLAPLIATDFRMLWPDLPVRFGALGALIMLYLGFGPASTGGHGWERLLSLTTFAAVAVLLAASEWASGIAADTGQLIRSAAIGLAGLMFAALVSEFVGARAERRKAADPLLEAADADDFMQRLRRHPVIGDARVLAEDDLAPLSHARFDSLLDAHPLLRGSDAPWGRSPTDDGVERALSLLATYGATHAMRLSRRPLRIAVLALPQAVADPRTESELKAAQRIGEFVFERGTVVP